MSDNSTQKYMLGNQDVDTSFLTLEMTWYGMRDKRIKDQIGMELPNSFEKVIEGTTINTYLVEDQLRTLIDKSAKSILEDEQLLSHLQEKTKETAANIRRFANTHVGRLESYSNNKLASFLQKSRELQGECVTYGTVIAFADVFGAISDKVMGIIKKRDHLSHSVSTYVNALGNPEKESLSEKAYKDIQKTNKPDAELLEEYYWLNQGYIGRGLTKEELENTREDENDSAEKIRREELKQELGLSEAEERVFEISQSLVYLKSLRADSRQFIYVLVNRVVDMLSERWKTPSSHISVMSANELGDILRGESSLPDNLEQRYEHSVLVPKNEDYKVLTGAGADKFVDKRVQDKEVENVEQLEGQVAHGGEVQGTVRLVFGPQHNDKVEKGDILVSTATSPQLIPAMRRAAAFVTQVGGVTSHAAIVAREMKKPCIVGVESVTEILNDGDKVQVNADESVVEIIG